MIDPLDNIAGVLFIIGGIIQILAVTRKWNWFVNHYRVIKIYKLLGEKRGNIFYIVLGLVIIIFGMITLF
jgi:predicted phage tail protein